MIYQKILNFFIKWFGSDNPSSKESMIVSLPKSLSLQESIIETARDTYQAKINKLNHLFSEKDMCLYSNNLIKHIIDSDKEDFILISHFDIGLPDKDLLKSFYYAFFKIATEIGLKIQWHQANFIKVNVSDISSFIQKNSIKESIDIFHTGIYR